MNATLSARPQAAVTAMLLAVAVTLATGAAAADVATAPQQIRAAAEDAVRQTARRAGATITATAADLDPRLQLPACAGPLQTQVTGEGQLRESTTVGVRCETPVRWNIYIKVAIASRVSVLTARHPLARDAVPSPADFETATRTVPGFGNRYISDAAALAGAQLRRPLAAGEALTAESLVRSPVIRRGQRLTLVARTGAMEIRVAAIALADGRPDERIAVQNVETHRVIEGVVRSSELVEVSL